MKAVTRIGFVRRVLLVFGMVCGVFGVYTPGATAAEDQPDRLRAEAGELKQKAQQLIEQSRKLAQTADEMEAKRGAPGPSGDEPRAKMKEKPERQASDPRQPRPQSGPRYREQENPERQALGPMPRRDFEPPPAGPRPPQPGFRPGPQRFAEAQERLTHLQAAIDNLQAAGLRGPAERLQRDADRMQRRLAAGGRPNQPEGSQPPGPPRPRPGAGFGGDVVRPGPGPGGPRTAELMDEVQQLRQAVDRLNQRVNELAGRLR